MKNGSTIGKGEGRSYQANVLHVTLMMCLHVFNPT